MGTTVTSTARSVERPVVRMGVDTGAGRPVPHGGVMYVGPSLTRSLLGVAVAISRASA